MDTAPDVDSSICPVFREVVSVDLMPLVDGLGEGLRCAGRRCAADREPDMRRWFDPDVTH